MYLKFSITLMIAPVAHLCSVTLALVYKLEWLGPHNTLNENQTSYS